MILNKIFIDVNFYRQYLAIQAKYLVIKPTDIVKTFWIEFYYLFVVS